MEERNALNPPKVAMLQDSDMSDLYSDDELTSEDETASSPISLSKSLSATPPYSPCSMSSHSDGESDTAEVTDESSLGSENLQWSGYRIVTDNYDMNIAPSFQRLDKQKQLLHYMHSCAVKDRINMTSLSEERPKWKEHKASDLLPSVDDITALKEEMIILLSRQVKRSDTSIAAFTNACCIITQVHH